MSLRSTILSEFAQVAREHDKMLCDLTDDTPLLESGLDSLCFAIVVVRLEDVLGIDPFETAAAEKIPVTFGDFVRFYESAVHG